jgi:hypothetical protein
VLAAAAVHGGTEPGLLDEVASWQGDDFWQYAVYAAVACIRAAASRAGVPVRQACQDLDERLRPSGAITPNILPDDRSAALRQLCAGAPVLRDSPSGRRVLIAA